MRNHLSGLWLSLVYSLKTISKYFFFFSHACLLFLRMSPPLPVQRPTPSQLRHIPGSTSPSQPPRARIGWWDQGSRGPHHTGRVWRTEIASPWVITSTTTACRYRSLSLFFWALQCSMRPKKIRKSFIFHHCVFPNHILVTRKCLKPSA